MTARKSQPGPDAQPTTPGHEEPVVLPIEDWIDLHAFAPRDVPAVVEEYLNECYRRGWREVRLVHGRGIGVQREIVRSILSRTPFVLTFADAPAEAGGWGATRVTLKPNPQPEKDKQDGQDNQTG